VVLLCFNGNRSSQLASEFEAQGYKCRFMIGGYEKWLAEDRPLEMRGDYPRTSLREIPDYPNRDELLDTPEVVELMEQGDPLFVDVRYPGDFDNDHLPGAVDIPMRKLTTSELDAALKALPKRPIIVPCYDRRSSFFGMVIGLRLHRLGYEFLGRYTTPAGYAVPKKDKPHVAAWKAAHAPKSLLTLASERFEGVLSWSRARLGSLALAIVALVVALRALIAPLTAKAERDRRVQASLAGELSALKARYADDPHTRARATSRLLDAAGVRPMWNLVATLAQLLFFTLFFSVVQRASTGSEESFLWLKKLADGDATHALPIAVAALGAGLVALVSRRRVALWLAPLAALALGALVWRLSSGANLYLALSLALAIVHNLAVGWWLGRDARRASKRERIARKRFEHSPVVPLEYAHMVSGCGNKAARLGRLIEARLPVPRGFVVRSHVLAQRARDGEFRGEDRTAIEAAHRTLASERVAVRSSGANEDGAERSYAGVFDTVLDVTAERLFGALDEVSASLRSARAGTYSKGERESGAIVVQAMVPAATPACSSPSIPAARARP
jgi:membrane protein insertase Oxa1/YidC/SpoIIIJ